jgi:DNA-binding NarL/FixJ family response regulator
MADDAHILLVGPQVSQLGDFVEARGYQVTCRDEGKPALGTLREGTFDVVVLELDLGDLVAQEFMRDAVDANPGCAFVLLEDPAKAHRIVSAMAQGIFAFVPTPPNEEVFFHALRRLVASGPDEAERALHERIEELELRIRTLKMEKANGKGVDDRTQDVFATQAFDDDSSDAPSLDDSEIAIKVPVDEHKTSAFDAEFEALATQMMPAQRRVRGSEDYRKVVENVWARLPDTNPEGA